MPENIVMALQEVSDPYRGEFNREILTRNRSLDLNSPDLREEGIIDQILKDNQICATFGLLNQPTEDAVN